MEEKYGLPFCSIMHRKVIHVIFSPVFSAIFAGPRFVEVQRFYYHGNETWHSDLSSVLTCVGYLVRSLTH